MSSVSQALALPRRSGARSAIFRRLRLRQIRTLASLLIMLGRRRAPRRIIARLRSSTPLLSLINYSLGYRRRFGSFEAAQACASKYLSGGHDDPDLTNYYRSMCGRLCESDYPVLFYLAPFAHRIRQVFDLGGNIGNIFYSYAKRLAFPPDLTWFVYDLPSLRAQGERIAAERAEARLHFINSFAPGQNSDLFIASGSFHYFDESLEALIQRLGGNLPEHVILNRTPCSSRADLITVQDNGNFLAPCKLHSRARLLDGMARLGYGLVAEWPVFQLKLEVPMYPDWSARTYSGFYFRHRTHSS